jgi:uncharacterized protein
MKCPIDDTPLVMTDRKGIEIDYCPTCRGVWLDRGELDKIIERTSMDQPMGAAAATAARQPAPYGNQHDRNYRGDSKHEQPYKPHYKRRKSMLGEIFDIFD